MNYVQSIAVINACSHLSFTINKEYPWYYKTKYYEILRNFDILSHLILYLRYHSIIHAIMFTWHILKKDTLWMCKFTFMNYIDTFIYIKSSYNGLKYMNGTIKGLLIYLLLKHKKIIY